MARLDGAPGLDDLSRGGDATVDVVFRGGGCVTASRWR
jgi:hypothetical protein